MTLIRRHDDTRLVKSLARHPFAGARVVVEVPLAELGRQLAKRPQPEPPQPRAGKRRAARIGGMQLNRRAAEPARFGQRHGDGQRFLAGRARDAPDADRAAMQPRQRAA